jgi:hypothetical protein
MGMPQHPEFTPINQQSGWSPLRLGLVIFIAAFLAIISSCYAMLKYSDYEKERERNPHRSFWKDYDEGGVRH